MERTSYILSTIHVCLLLFSCVFLAFPYNLVVLYGMGDLEFENLHWLETVGCLSKSLYVYQLISNRKGNNLPAGSRFMEHMLMILCD